MCVCTYVQEYVHVCVNTCSVLLVRGSVIPYLLHRSRHSGNADNLGLSLLTGLSELNIWAQTLCLGWRVPQFTLVPGSWHPYFESFDEDDANWVVSVALQLLLGCF